MEGGVVDCSREKGARCLLAGCAEEAETALPEIPFLSLPSGGDSAVFIVAEVKAVSSCFLPLPHKKTF